VRPDISGVDSEARQPVAWNVTGVMTVLQSYVAQDESEEELI
jgi:hypothetical protein